MAATFRRRRGQPYLFRQTRRATRTPGIADARADSAIAGAADAGGGSRRASRARDEAAELRSARERLFARWVEVHPEAASSAQYIAAPLEYESLRDLPFAAPHFTDYVLGMALGRGTRGAGQSTDGFIPARAPDPRPQALATTLDLRLQTLAERVLANYIREQQSIGIHNACALLVDYRDMSVRAMVGSADFHSAAIHGQVNGTLARRSPGSALKPFIYALAIDQGVIHPLTVLKDAPTSFGPFSPENFDGRFVGPITATDALIRSRNVPAVALSAQLAQPSFYQLLKTAGIAQIRLVDAVAASGPIVEPVFRQPPRLERIDVCSASGDLPNAECPQIASTWYIPGVSPIRVSQIHRRVWIDSRTGKQACAPYDPANTRSEVFEFWPTDLLQLFAQAGMPRRRPPPSAACQRDVPTGTPPRITSPVTSATYTVRANRIGAESIPLAANADGEVRRLHWFVGESYIGTGAPVVAIAWSPAQAGRYIVRAVDDRGRADSRELNVALVR